MVALEITDVRLDLDPLSECLTEPGFMAVRMGSFSFHGDHHPFCSPASPAVLLLLEGLVEILIGGHLLGASPGVSLSEQ